MFTGKLVNGYKVFQKSSPEFLVPVYMPVSRCLLWMLGVGEKHQLLREISR
jgi:hypothetical protein